MLYHVTKHLGDRFGGSGASLNRALGGFVGTSTIGALPVLLFLVALRYDVPYSLAPIGPGNAVVRVRVVEDGHFDWSLARDGSRTTALTILGASIRGN